MTARKPVSEAVGVPELMRASGLGEDAVRAAILTGQLPGYKIGSRFVCPREAFDAFCAGRWVPVPKPLPEIRPIRQATEFLAKRKAS